MRAAFIFIIHFTTFVCSELWPKGIVHYNINSKDYDLHSQDLIMATFGRIEREICVKFFNSPMNYSANVDNKILYINNPEKDTDCPPRSYDYNKSVIDLVIGYKCLNDKDIARTVVEMLKASVARPDPANKLNVSMIAPKPDPARTTLLSPVDRTFIKTYYNTECSNLDTPGAALLSARKTNGENPEKSALSVANMNYYKTKIWALGLVLYSVDPNLRDTPEHTVLRSAMTDIEAETCIIFLDDNNREVLLPRNSLWFGKGGANVPPLGVVKGNQSINLYKMAHGRVGHEAHLLNNLMRTLGVPMMSNRYDRDNYVFVHWGLVEKGNEYLLERMPEEAWIRSVPYDFDSVTHAPANYLCSNSNSGAYTVQPQEDNLWHRTLSMGHKLTLSNWDKKAIQLLYSQECAQRDNINKGFIGRRNE